MVEYSQGICEDGAAILKDGKMMTVEEIVAELNMLSFLMKKTGCEFRQDVNGKAYIVAPITGGWLK